MLLSLVPSNDLVRVGCGGGVSYRKRTTRTQSAYCAAQRSAMQCSAVPRPMVLPNMLSSPHSSVCLCLSPSSSPPVDRTACIPVSLSKGRWSLALPARRRRYPSHHHTHHTSHGGSNSNHESPRPKPPLQSSSLEKARTPLHPLPDRMGCQLHGSRALDGTCSPRVVSLLLSALCSVFTDCSTSRLFRR